jgi:membrane protease YdiL (CAAX protease family)
MPTKSSLEDRLSQMAGEYWHESRRPFASLVFVAPLLVAYETGVLLLSVQNGADAWMRGLLNCLGFSQHFLLPAMMICILLSWHHLSRQPWRLSPGIVWTMAAESVLLAVGLQMLLQLQGTVLQAVPSPGLMQTGTGSATACITVRRQPLLVAVPVPVFVTFSSAQPSPVSLEIAAKFKDGIGFLGAGIYEELLFRLILLSLAVWAFRRCIAVQWLSLGAAILVTSLIFSSAHYVGQYGDVFTWFGFLFRFLAGLFFSVLFVYRGFGIAAGAHAAYDILVGLF